MRPDRGQVTIGSRDRGPRIGQGKRAAQGLRTFVILGQEPACTGRGVGFARRNEQPDQVRTEITLALRGSRRMGTGSRLATLAVA
jgi:hypothetical protein